MAGMQRLLPLVPTGLTHSTRHKAVVRVSLGIGLNDGSPTIQSIGERRAGRVYRFAAKSKLKVVTVQQYPRLRAGN